LANTTVHASLTTVHTSLTTIHASLTKVHASLTLWSKCSFLHCSVSEKWTIQRSAWLWVWYDLSIIL